MKDTELYTRLLSLSRPWFIREVRYRETPERIDVYVDHEPGMEMPCPECDRYGPVYDHMEERSWQHLHTCHVPTFIHARLPRIQCPEHGVRCVISAWSEPGSEMTRVFECYLIDLEQECSLEGVSRLTGLSWDRCWGVMTRAVARGWHRKEEGLPIHLGVDEKSFRRGHDYETVVYDLDNGTVEYVADGRRQESLEEYFLPFDEEAREKVESVSLDMWEPYIAATHASIPNAEEKIVFDKFHVMGLLNEAVDQVRRQEHQELMEKKIAILKGTKYWWLYNPENIPEEVQPDFDTLRRMDLKVSRAWAIRETFRNLWDYTRRGWARRFFQRWYQWATHSRLAPIIKAAKTIQRHLDNILTYLVHGITNALSEALNAHIEKVKRMACGYRNREHFKMAIYFHCGGLDLYPKSPALSTTISGGYPQ